MKKEDKLKIISTLNDMFPNSHCELNFKNNFELICAVILSAQCTDKRVNLITPALFKSYPTPYKLALANLNDVETIIKPCGFYHNKAKNLINMAKGLVQNFEGIVPNNLPDLITLSGVGRKTANVVYAVGFGGQAIAVDTHVFRTSNRLGLANSKNVLNTEKQLMRAVPKGEWSKTHHSLIFLGRYICKARKPLCEKCDLKPYCKYFNTKIKNTLSN